VTGRFRGESNESTCKNDDCAEEKNTTRQHKHGFGGNNLTIRTTAIKGIPHIKNIIASWSKDPIAPLVFRVWLYR
jgi:hypothetical protein